MRSLLFSFEHLSVRAPNARLCPRDGAGSEHGGHHVHWCNATSAELDAPKAATNEML
jgi:hypothetical protein